MSQLFFVFKGTEEQEDKITKTKKLIQYLLIERITKLTYIKTSEQ